MDIKIKKLLIIILIINIGILTFVYYFTNKTILTIPVILTNYEIESNIKSKIVNPTELDFLLSKYNKNINGNTYLLNTNKNDEKEKIKTILINNGYFIDNTERGIETPTKKFINGYLGQFFRFKYFNTINWLIIPIIIYLLITYKRRRKIELAFILFYIISSFVISLKGFINFRYQLTFQPITITFIFYYIYKITSKNKLDKLRPYLSVFLILNIIINGIIFNFDFIKQSTKYIKNDNSINQSINKKSINEMVNYINKLELEPNTKILNNNIPFLYYYTDKPAVYYLSELDTYYSDEGSKTLTLNNPISNLGTFIKNELKCNYILSSHSHNQYNYVFKKFLETKTKLIFQSGDFLLYKIN